ncbi:MAG: hypothetical protein WDA42_04820 [Candidatus Bathyarchaeia archaeon]
MPIISTLLTQPFDQVTCDTIIQGGTRISWSMDPRFCESEDWVFQVYANKNADEPNNWVPVGSPVTNTYFVVDPTQRMYGKDARLSYKVVLTIGDDEYTSPIATTLGNLTVKQQLIANAIVRRASLERSQLPKSSGWLFRRRLYGTPCSCVDELVGTSTDPDCETCFGTGKVYGYWQGVAETLYDLSPATRYNTVDDQLVQGTIDAAAIRQGVLIGEPFVESKDLFVLANSDQRYSIKEIKHVAEIGNIPIVTQITMALLPLTHIAYKLDLATS